MYSLDQQLSITQILSSDFSQEDEVSMFPLPPTKDSKIPGCYTQEATKRCQREPRMSGGDGPMDSMPVSSLSFWPKALHAGELSRFPLCHK